MFVAVVISCGFLNGISVCFNADHAAFTVEADCIAKVNEGFLKHMKVAEDPALEITGHFLKCVFVSMDGKAA